MSTISNSFFVQVLEDGSMLRGQIRSTKPLSQAYNNGNCIKDWTVTDNQPIVYIMLQNRAEFVVPDSNYKWFYNGFEITWNGNTSNKVSTLAAGTFQKVDYSPTEYGGTKVPAIKIVKNIASSNNVDIDVIRFDGKKTLSTNAVDFSASISVTITEIVKGGYFGLIECLSDDSDISNTNDYVDLKGLLYDGISTDPSTGEITPISAGVSYKWYFEGSSQVAATTQQIRVTESQVTDYVVMRCEFWMNEVEAGVSTPKLVATAYFEIDDTQDPEEMQFAYNGANGKSASLRNGESVAFTIWIGKRNDPQFVYKKYHNFKVKLVDDQKNTIMDSLTSYDPSIANADENGYRTMNVTTSGANEGKATITIPYKVASLQAGNGATSTREGKSGGLNGVVVATSV